MLLMMNALVILSVVVTTAMGSCPVSVPKTTASSYQALGDDCYYFAVKHKERFDAEGICIDADGSLASIHSKEENEFIRKHFAETYKINSKVHIGLEQLIGEFEWLDHSSFDFKNFASKDSYKPFYEDTVICTTIDPKDGKWYAYRCFWQSDPLPYICKFKGANV